MELLVIGHVCAELSKTLLTCFLAGCVHLHIHQTGAAHIKSLLALSELSPQKCKCFSVYSVVSYGSNVHFLGK